MVNPERRQFHVSHFGKTLGISDWKITFEKVDSTHIFNDIIKRRNNNMVGVRIEDAENKCATILHTREILTKEDIAHELVHIAHPDWSDHKMVEKETERILFLKKR